MAGSGDEDSIQDVMLKMHMTELEAVIYMGYGTIDSFRAEDAQCVARDLAAYLIKHLPESDDDGQPDGEDAERKGD